MLLHRQKCVIEHRDIRHSLRNSPPDCFCQMLRIWSLVSQVQILQINKKGSRTFRLLHRQKGVIDHRNIRHSLRNSPPDCFCQMLRIWSLVSQVQILQTNKKGSRTFFRMSCFLLVEVTRFELATPTSRTWCSTKLSHTSIYCYNRITQNARGCKCFLQKFVLRRVIGHADGSQLGLQRRPVHLQVCTQSVQAGIKIPQFGIDYAKQNKRILG